MAKLLKKFDNKGKDEMDDRSVIPNGIECLFVIKKSDYVKTKDKKGHMAKFQLTVKSGKYKGRMVFVDLNLDNPSAAAVEIADKEFTSLTLACGLRVVEKTEEVHGIPFMGKVGIEPAKGTFPEKNKIAKYWPAKSEKAGKASKADKPKNKDKGKGKKNKKPDVEFGGKKNKKKKKKK